ncbi:MAG: hypothetical protein HGA90_06590 [Alphaproteobacteria bacterium]|nr:hypothetical protein [Alphaproteobacteria bacterium]
MADQKTTPMMQQYLSIKEQHRDAILFYRMGDFYEMFLEDAEVASKVLEITLTSRNKNETAKIPMCGIPYRAAQGYIARLIESGHKVAICDQVEDPALAKGLVKREVVRVITPGMIVEDSFLDEKSNNYILNNIIMHGLSLLKKAIRLEPVERIPWVPFVGVHGAYLIGVDAEQYLKSAKNMVAGLSKAIELYKPDGIPVSFDLQLEAEILGCKLNWAKENPPAVVTHPLSEGVLLSSLKVPTAADDAAGFQFKRQFADSAAGWKRHIVHDRAVARRHKQADNIPQQNQTQRDTNCGDKIRFRGSYGRKHDGIMLINVPRVKSG